MTSVAGESLTIFFVWLALLVENQLLSHKCDYGMLRSPTTNLVDAIECVCGFFRTIIQNKNKISTSKLYITEALSVMATFMKDIILSSFVSDFTPRLYPKPSWKIWEAFWAWLDLQKFHCGADLRPIFYLFLFWWNIYSVPAGGLRQSLASSGIHQMSPIGKLNECPLFLSTW